MNIPLLVNTAGSALRSYSWCLGARISAPGAAPRLPRMPRTNLQNISARYVDSINSIILLIVFYPFIELPIPSYHSTSPYSPGRTQNEPSSKGGCSTSQRIRPRSWLPFHPRLHQPSHRVRSHTQKRSPGQSSSQWQLVRMLHQVYRRRWERIGRWDGSDYWRRRMVLPHCGHGSVARAPEKGARKCHLEASVSIHQRKCCRRGAIHQPLRRSTGAEVVSRQRLLRCCTERAWHAFTQRMALCLISLMIGCL